MTAKQEQYSTPKLVIRKISKTFYRRKERIPALEKISLDVMEGEFLCFVGPSGCGKSTLLNIIAGLEIPEKGKILEDGEALQGPGQDRTVMFQESALFPWLTVLGNVLYGLKLKAGLSKSERSDIAEHYLQLVGLEQFMTAHIHELSGGMKQRVALARALAPNPKVLLMDEPFAALDALTRENFYSDLQRIWQDTHKTILLVTHNVREAVCLGDRIFLFSPRPGCIREECKIPLPRARDISSVELAEHAAQITRSLKNVIDNTSKEAIHPLHLRNNMT